MELRYPVNRGVVHVIEDLNVCSVDLCKARLIHQKQHVREADSRALKVRDEPPNALSQPLKSSVGQIICIEVVDEIAELSLPDEFGEYGGEERIKVARVYDIAVVPQKEYELICPPERQIQQCRRPIVRGSYGALVRRVQRGIVWFRGAVAIPNQQFGRIAVRCQRFCYLVDAGLYPPPSNQRHLHFGCSPIGNSRSASTCSMETACPVERKISANRSGLAVSCHIGLHHHMHECLKRGLRRPAQPGTGF